MKAERARDRFMPWGGLALGTTGFFIAHQMGSDATFQDCRVGSPWIVILGTLVGLAIIALGAFASLPVFRSDSEGPARRVVAGVSLMAAALFALAVMLPFFASLIIPACWA
jgi:hypothetical protein